MKNRIATLEIDHPELKGKLAVYPNFSQQNPGFIVRCGAPYEDWTGDLRVGNLGYKVSIEFAQKKFGGKQNLGVRAFRVSRYPNNTFPPDSVTHTVVNEIRRALGRTLGIRVKEVAVPPQIDKYNKKEQPIGQ